jgi:O-antigen ligase
LPYTFQRSLAFLPLDISTEARMDTDDSTQWRLNMWEALMPQVPKYLLLGKGYAFSAETYDESMARDSAFKSIDAAEDPLALASDFHNGPLTVVIPFGIWGGIAWLWFWGAGLWAVWRNYRYGDEDLRRINIFILASYFARGMMFFFVVGSMVSDIAAFTGLAGLSVAINHGVSRRKAPSLAPRPKPAVVLSQPFGPPALPAAGRGI